MSTRLEIRIRVSTPAPVAGPVLPDPSTSDDDAAFSPAEVADEVAETAAAADSADAPVEIPLPMQEIFFKSSELEQQPSPLAPVLPEYPAHARAKALEGSVRLLLMIDERGGLRHLEVLDASPPGIFDEAALSAFRSVPFSPGRRGDEAVKSRMIIKVDFVLEAASGQD